MAGAELLDVFDEKLSEAGQQVSEKRRAYLELLAPLARENYRDISQGREEMEICYLPSYDARGLAHKLKETRSRDIAAGFCTGRPAQGRFRHHPERQAGKAVCKSGASSARLC